MMTSGPAWEIHFLERFAMVESRSGGGYGDFRKNLNKTQVPDIDLRKQLKRNKL